MPRKRKTSTGTEWVPTVVFLKAESRTSYRAEGFQRVLRGFPAGAAPKPPLLDSSHEAEAVASAKAAEQIAYAREVLRALGVLPAGATPLLTDNLANALVARDATSAARAKHFFDHPFQVYHVPSVRGHWASSARGAAHSAQDAAERKGAEPPAARRNLAFKGALVKGTATKFTFTQ